MDEPSKDFEETEAVNSGDLLVQLKEKLKTQAQRIRSLESYKVLCEERISELCPSHPLPVLPEHIGSSGASMSQVLINSKQKIAKLEQQLSQTADLIPSPSNSVTYNKLHELYTLLHQRYNSLLKDKTEVEESLRNEMVLSEEQRAYIEVLKQAIEIKTESLGLQGIRPEEFAEYSNMKINTDESRRETSKLSTKLLDYESQIKSLTETLKIKNNEIKELNYERDELTDQLHQAAEALQYAEEEVQKLEEEKTNLLEYVETQGRSEADSDSQIKDLKTQLEVFQIDNKTLTKQLNSITSDNKKLLEDIENIRNEHDRNEKTLKETQQSFANLKSRIEEKDKTIQRYKEENNNISIQNSSLQAQNISLIENQGKIENELSVHKSELDLTKIDEDKLKETLTQLRGYSQKIQEEKCRIESKYLETDYKLQNLQSDFIELSEKHQVSLENFNAKSLDLENITKSYKALQETEESLIYSITETKKQNSVFQAEIDSLLKQLQSVNNNYSGLNQEYEQLKIKLLSMAQENNVLEIRIKENVLIIDSERQKTKFLEDSNQALKSKIDEINFEVKEIYEKYQDRDYQCKNIEFQLESLSKSYSQLQNEIIEEKYNKTTKTEELLSLSNETKALRKEFLALKENYDIACRVSKNISSVLGPTNSQRFKEISLNFSEQLSSDFILHKWIESAIQEIKDLSVKYTETVQMIDAIKHKNTLLNQDLETANQDYSNLKSKELLLKSQIEELSHENKYLKESLKSQVGSLQQEILNLRSDMQGLYEENEQFSNKNRSLSNDLSYLKNRLVSQDQNYLTLEKKFKILAGEKEHLESILGNYKSLDKPMNISYRSN
jgi:chromosome segregation ATPase